VLWGVLEKERARSCPQRLVDVLVAVKGREHHRAGGMLAGGDPPRRLDAVYAGHPYVHQDDIRGECLRPRHGLAAVARFAHDLDVGLGLEDHAEPGPHEALVVGQEDADHRAEPNGSLARTAYPPSARAPCSSSPPYTATRSRIPASPCPEPPPFGAPTPSSRISSSRSSDE
jgi:hypothetical protein